MRAQTSPMLASRIGKFLLVPTRYRLRVAQAQVRRATYAPQKPAPVPPRGTSVDATVP